MTIAEINVAVRFIRTLEIWLNSTVISATIVVNSQTQIAFLSQTVNSIAAYICHTYAVYSQIIATFACFTFSLIAGQTIGDVLRTWNTEIGFIDVRIDAAINTLRRIRTCVALYGTRVA